MVEDAAMAARALQQQALDLARRVTAFRLDEARQEAPIETALPDADLRRPGRAGQSHLMLVK
jgi:methyl-accepting chemotaxis protein